VKKRIIFIISFVLITVQQAQNSGWNYYSPIPITTYHSFGDSITSLCCNGASPTTNGYVYLISTDMGYTLTNYGTGSEMAADMGDSQIYPNENPTETGIIYTGMIGTNDAAQKGAGTYEAVYNLCSQGEIAWLTVTKKCKTFGQNSSVIQTGTWTNDNTYQTNIGIQSTTNGSTLSMPITTTGGNIYLWYRVMDGNGGVFSYKLDGGAPTTINCFTSPAIATLLGGTQGVGIVRITSVSSGTHTVLLTVTSSTGAGNIVSTLGVGTVPGPSTGLGPKLFWSGVIREQNDQNSTDTAAYNADAQANANLFNGDGLPVYFVDDRLSLNTTTDMNDRYHPKYSGHQGIAGTFESVIKAH